MRFPSVPPQAAKQRDLLRRRQVAALSAGTSTGAGLLNSAEFQELAYLMRRFAVVHATSRIQVQHTAGRVEVQMRSALCLIRGTAETLGLTLDITSDGRGTGPLSDGNTRAAGPLTAHEFQVLVDLLERLEREYCPGITGGDLRTAWCRVDKEADALGIELKPLEHF